MNIRHFFPILFLAVFGFTFSACVDQDFDEPPVRTLADLSDEVNATIKQVKELHTVGANPTLIEEDWVVSGVVRSDDEAGNFYQQIIVEDASAGVLIRLGANGLAALYPEGSEVFVRLKGLYIGDYNGYHQISGDSEGNVIASPLMATYVIAGAPKDMPATTVLLGDVVNNASVLEENTGRLIVLENVEFADVELGGTYGDLSSTFSAENRTVQDCNGNTIIMRNSNYADFAGTDIPEGNGTLTAVLSVFGSTPQLTIRDTDDTPFTGPRCSGGGQTGGELVTIQSIRDAYAAGTTEGPADSKIKGVVISDIASGNINGRNIVIQDETAGIVVRFANDHNFNLGQEVEVTVSGQELSDFNGLVQVNNVSLGSASLVGNGTLPTPRVATVAEIMANGDAWESTLVKIVDANLNGGPTYGDGVTVNDGTGDINMFTFFSANFSDDNIPTTTGELTAIISDFNGIQLNMRNAADANFEGGGGGGDPTPITAAELRTMFGSGTTSAPAAKILRGIVISDAANGNITGRNMVIQDASGGIVVRFADNHSFALGEDVEINVSNMELSEFNGLLQINNVPNANAVSYGTGTMPTPRVATFQEILDNSEEWESTLVIVSDVTAPAGTYNGSVNLTDGTATMPMYTRADASFSGSTMPTTAFTLVAIVSQFNDVQVNIRNLDDIQ